MQVTYLATFAGTTQIPASFSDKSMWYPISPAKKESTYDPLPALPNNKAQWACLHKKQTITDNLVGYLFPPRIVNISDFLWILVATLSNRYSHRRVVNAFELTAFPCDFIFQCYNYCLIYYWNDELIFRMTTFSFQNRQNMILHVLDMLIDIFFGNLIPGLTDGCLQFIETGRQTWASLNIIFEGFPKGLYGTEIG